jgi:hypothetical protein
MRDHLWADHFERIAIPQVEILLEVLDQRIMPAFDTIADEGMRHSEETYRRLGSMPASDAGLDMAAAAEMAQEEGLARYESLSGVRQAILNALAIALYHLLEQHLLFFHRRHVLHPSEENDPTLWKVQVLIERLRAKGLDLTAMKNWPMLQELRLTANALKHGDGQSADELHKRRPELFLEPTLRRASLRWSKYKSHVFAPMAGDDLFVSVEDFHGFAEYAINFLKELSQSLRP